MYTFRLPNQRFGASVKRSPIRDPFDSPWLAQGDADRTKSNGSATADRQGSISPSVLWHQNDAIIHLPRQREARETANRRGSFYDPCPSGHTFIFHYSLFTFHFSLPFNPLRQNLRFCHRGLRALRERSRPWKNIQPAAITGITLGTCRQGSDRHTVRRRRAVLGCAQAAQGGAHCGTPRPQR